MLPSLGEATPRVVPPLSVPESKRTGSGHHAAASDKELRTLRRYLTTRDGDLRLHPETETSLVRLPSPDESLCWISVDDGHAFQEIEGFGGAFTEAAAVTWQALPASTREKVLRAYFDPVEGLGYTLCRTHINSCDFSLGNYAHCEKDGDFALEYYTIERDRRALVPMIREALATARDAGSGFRLFASPWSPPAWMKTNGQMNQGGKLRPECRDAWARCYVRFIEEYAKEGIPVWGLTVQNEPAAVQRWDSCVYTGEEERDFVRDHLGPVLHAAGMEDVKVIVWDHNRNLLYERARAVLDDPAAARYVWGVGFHWYVADCFESLERTHAAWPDKKLLFTEGCQEGGPHLGAWGLGERYARSVINDLNRWTVGWVDWNLLLDIQGGPNHVGNYCSAPILADPATGEVHYQTSYYYLGHFSRFIRTGGRRILCVVGCDELEATACRNPDGSVAVVVLNRSEKRIPFALSLRGEGAMLDAPARSIQTLVLSAGA
ncbi:MAG TPA: glycoside hydrolase family 30 protein [Candidatus Methylacidiphilales bacterium]